MKSKFITFVLALLTSVGTLFAWDYEHVQIGDLYYNLDATNLTAEVTYKEYYYNYSINAVSIPLALTWEGKTYSVTSIGEYAFYGCSSLTSVTIPNSVTNIGGSAFRYCSGLTSVTIGNSVTSIGFGAFRDCSGLTSVIIPNSVTSIGDFAFDGCSGLTSVTIPNSVTSIGESAFRYCSGLTSVTIGNSVTSIGEYAFYGCSGLTSVTIGNSVTSIGQYAFYGCSSLTSVTIPNSVTSIGSPAFSGCSGLTSMSVEDGNTVYDSRDNCNAIIETSTNTLIAGCKNTIIPNSVTSIGRFAFEGCSGLTSITIPNSVTSIGSFAFEGCSGLTSITIPNSVTSIELVAFRDCSGLTSVFVEDGNTAYDSRDNCNAIIETSTNTLIAGCKNTIIPNSVTSIGRYAFDDCRGLTSVTIPNSVTSIGEAAFRGCSGLTSVTIGNSVTSIGESAFRGCSGLTSVTIPNSVTSIRGYAFSDCSSLSDILVKWTTSEALASVSLGSKVFNNVPTSAKLHIPAEAWGIYSASPWSDFTNRVATCNDDVDNTSFFSAQNGNTIDFELGRTIYKDGYYNTICLPFDIDDLEGTPLEGATVKEFVNAEVVDGCLELNVTDATAIEAGKPYLVSFESGEDMTDAVFEDVTIATSTAQTIDGGAVDFVGILAPTDLGLNNTNMLFLGANNELYWPNTNDPLRGYRAYFAVNNGSSAPVRYGMPARIVEQQNTATAIAEDAVASMPEKKLVNGSLVISRGNTSYNVLGMTIR